MDHDLIIEVQTFKRLTDAKCSFSLFILFLFHVFSRTEKHQEVRIQGIWHHLYISPAIFPQQVRQLPAPVPGTGLDFIRPLWQRCGHKKKQLFFFAWIKLIGSMGLVYFTTFFHANQLLRSGKYIIHGSYGKGRCGPEWNVDEYEDIPEIDPTCNSWVCELCGASRNIFGNNCYRVSTVLVS